MEIVILPGDQAIGSLGADAFENLLRRKPDAVLGLATGSSPLAMLATARSQLAQYPTVTFIDGEATAASRTDEGFGVTVASSEPLESVRLVLAFGISDELPAIPGLAERWGASVLHCPYCHGFEFSGQRLGVLYLTPKSIMQSMLIAEWGPTRRWAPGPA